MSTTPEAPSALPLKGGPPPDRPSRIRGIRWVAAAACLLAGLAWAATSLWQRLENDVALVRRSIAVPAQRGQGERPGQIGRPLREQRREAGAGCASTSGDCVGAFSFGTLAILPPSRPYS